jgi:hypothetical protein
MIRLIPNTFLQICFIFVAFFGVVVCVLVSHTTDLAGASVWDFNAGELATHLNLFFQILALLTCVQAFTPRVRLSLERPRPSSPGNASFELNPHEQLQTS